MKNTFLLFVCLFSLTLKAQIIQGHSGYDGGGGGDSIKNTPATVLLKVEADVITAVKEQWPKCSKLPFTAENVQQLHNEFLKHEENALKEKEATTIIKQALEKHNCPDEKIQGHPELKCFMTEKVKTAMKQVFESPNYLIYMVGKYQMDPIKAVEINKFYHSLIYDH